MISELTVKWVSTKPNPTTVGRRILASADIQDVEFTWADVKKETWGQLKSRTW